MGELNPKGAALRLQLAIRGETIVLLYLLNPGNPLVSLANVEKSRWNRSGRCDLMYQGGWDRGGFPAARPRANEIQAYFSAGEKT